MVEIIVLALLLYVIPSELNGSVPANKERLNIRQLEIESSVNTIGYMDDGAFYGLYRKLMTRGELKCE